jgi:hypothetical protein
MNEAGIFERVRTIYSNIVQHPREFKPSNTLVITSNLATDNTSIQSNLIDTNERLYRLLLMARCWVLIIYLLQSEKHLVIISVLRSKI